MKKTMALLLLVCLCGVVLLPAGLAENRVSPWADAYVGLWQCDRASLKITRDADAFRVLIAWSSSAWENTEWAYACVEQNGALISAPNGTCTNYVYGDDGSVLSAEAVYQDGEASFCLGEDGLLTWQDKKETRDEDMRFEKIASQPEAAASSVQYVLYLGTNDKDTNKPVFTQAEAMERAKEILLRHFGGYTIQEAHGGWVDGDTAYQEYTLVIYLSDTTQEQVHAAADELIAVFNQSSVLIQANPTATEFYSAQ